MAQFVNYTDYQTEVNFGEIKDIGKVKMIVKWTIVLTKEKKNPKGKGAAAVNITNYSAE